MNKLLKFLFVDNLYSTIIIILGLIFFTFFRDNLVIGGLILIIHSIMTYFPDNKKEDIFDKVGGICSFILGILALITKLFLPSKIDPFILSFLILSLIVIRIIDKLYHHIKQKLRIILIIIGLIISSGYTISMVSLIKYINDNGFITGYYYMSTILLLANTIYLYFLTIKFTMSTFNKTIFNDYVYLTAGILILTFIGGWFYIKLLPVKEQLVYFLVLIGVAIFGCLSAVDSLKSIIENEKRNSL